MADRIDDGQLHDLLGQQAQRPIGEPLGRLAQPQRDDLRFLLAIHLFLARWGLRFFTVQRARKADGHEALSELRTYIVHNRHVIPNDGERYHNGQAIATGFVESTVNEVVSKRCCKKQQMQWSKEGAHLLLQTHVRTLNGELGAIFKRWYPDMDLEVEEIPVAA